MNGANGEKINVTCPNCKTKQGIYERILDGPGKKCTKCWLTINKNNLKSSDCNNWNHQDCYNSKGNCNCKCHKPGTNEWLMYQNRRNRIRKEKEENRKKK